MTRITIVGSGNVAWHLAKAISEAEGLELVQIYSRNREHGIPVAMMFGCSFTDCLENLEPADMYIVAVSDSAISKITEKLKVGEAVVAHTAGGVSISEISQKIKNRAVLYPLQTFTKGRSVDFRSVPLMIEGNTPQALDCVRRVATALSDNVSVVDSNKRATIHLSAVFVSNFANHMYVIGERLLNGTGMNFDILKPLIRETAAKATESDSPVKMQTGPAIRNDFKTKAKHCEMLAQQPELKTMYINLSNNIWEISKKTSQK